MPSSNILNYLYKRNHIWWFRKRYVVKGNVIEYRLSLQTSIFLYTLACPPLVGFGIVKLAAHIPLIKKRGLTFVLLGLLMLPSIALVCIGINSIDWVMIIDFGTGLRVLIGALMGGLAANLTTAVNVEHKLEKSH
ncbi:hypothetical protein [Pseudescherichia sp.]|uniref:hypothetical protein n=1 Tax=Pseudescherichia sp. TaxID=2055881 RepID=UPI00289B846A|nr:hypothetical protein [Pseudescherichia sp.]